MSAIERDLWDSDLNFKKEQKIQRKFKAKFVQILKEIKEAKMKQIVLVIALFGAGM